MKQLDLEYFKEYYTSGDFEKGLKHYFPNQKKSDGYNTILQVDRYFNNDISMPYPLLFKGDGMEKSICFSIMFYYISLCNYVLYEIGGHELLDNFLKSTGWPWVNCGLGGIMSPNHTMEEADLVFVKNSANQKEALKLFHETVPFMHKELEECFMGESPSLNQEVYQNFIKGMTPHISDFWKMADKEINAFTFLKDKL